MDASGLDRPISVALLAMGGQGGGVVSDWLVAMATAEGWAVQSTSVPGVAQRTGATIYYVEMMRPREGLSPVLSLMPTPGDVDVVLAAEFMEAGRSILRGLVTPDRTTLITSTHRSFAVGEKEQPGDGIADSGLVVNASGIAARRVVAFDMQKVAEANGSVISAALFGALAGAAVLPFPREAFEGAIRAGGKGVSGSLRAFAAAYDRARQQPTPEEPTPAPAPALPGPTGHPELDRLLDRLRTEFPAEAAPMLFSGLRKVVDYQDAAYGALYLDRVATVAALDRGGEPVLAIEAAKHVANAMAFDDVIRVADLKTRASRFARVRTEVGAPADAPLAITEFMHPRMEEVLGTLPAGLALRLEARARLVRALDRVVNRGRRVRTDTVFWFLGLYAIAGLKHFRPRSLRFRRETEHLEAWLATVREAASRDPAVAAEMLRNRRLVKGYSDTHARGTSKFDRVMAASGRLLGRPDAADWIVRLRTAALRDEEGKALDDTLRTIDTFL